ASAAAEDRNTRLEPRPSDPTTAALSWLLARSGSNWSARTTAVLTTVPTVSTRAATCRTAVAPAGRGAPSHRVRAASKVPWLGRAPTRASPGGTASATTTFVAVSGPLLWTVRVKNAGEPTTTWGLFTVLVTTRSACDGMVTGSSRGPLDTELLFESPL